ncbi:MAG: hypothetical protein ACXWSD_10785, partial [Bdellovibrionota bacterium]
MTVDLSRIPASPEVFEAAKVVARKLKPYGKVYLTEAFRSPQQQEAIIASGVRAGPATGPKASIHITGVAVDLEIYGPNRERETCAALNQILPMLKGKGGVIMEGYSAPGESPAYPNGVTNMHIDDSWGARLHAGKAVNYTHGVKVPYCDETFGVTKNASEFARMAAVQALPTSGPVPAQITQQGGQLHDSRVTAYPKQ